MMIATKTCTQCNNIFTPSSRHKLCPKCRDIINGHCANCGKTIRSRYKLCNSCSNKTRVSTKDPREIAINYTLKKCRLRDKELTVDYNYLSSLLYAQQCKCAYTGLPMSLPSAKGCSDRRLCASLDRIDSSKGYIEGNVQWVIMPINFLKNGLSDLDTRELLSWIKN